MKLFFRIFLDVIGNINVSVKCSKFGPIVSKIAPENHLGCQTKMKYCELERFDTFLWSFKKQKNHTLHSIHCYSF